MRNDPQGHWLNVRRAAERAGVSTDTIYKECNTLNSDGQPRMRHVRIGGNGVLRLLPEWVDDWVLGHDSARRTNRKRKGDETDNGSLQTV